MSKKSKNKLDKSLASPQQKPSEIGKKNRSRRDAIRAIVMGGGAIASAKTLPTEWARPIVNTVILPSHATTSDTVVMSSVSAVTGITANDGSSSNNLLNVFMSQANALSLPVATKLPGACVKLTVAGSVATAELTLNDSSVDTKVGSVSGTVVTVDDLQAVYSLTAILDSAATPTSAIGEIMGAGEKGNFKVSVSGGSCTPVTPETTTTTSAAPTTPAPTTTPD